jgi:hypothetical protein
VDDVDSVDTATRREGVGAAVESVGGEVGNGACVSLLEGGDGSGKGSSKTYDVRGDTPNQEAMPL